MESNMGFIRGSNEIKYTLNINIFPAKGDQNPTGKLI